MESVPAILKKVTRTTTRRRTKSTSQETSRKRRTKDVQKKQAAIVTTMKENCVKMQEISIGLQRLQPMELACKENIHGAGGLRSRKPTPLMFGTSREGGNCTFGELSTHQTNYPQVPSNPLPRLSWVNSGDLWQRMRAKDSTRAAPEAELRMRHPNILPNMRTILLDWMMEVCEEYKLHRETFYLSVDMYDRFMDTHTGVQKEQLQLIGITCLFIASKIEEIYPPKVTEFAYVTDGACNDASILDTELIICKVLGWRLNHHSVTVNTWVNVYTQLSSHHLRPPGVKAKEFEYPAYSSMEFIRVMQLLDLCILDVAHRHFSSSVLAATALYLASERSRSHLGMITGLELSDIQLCVNWMQPCATILSQKGVVIQKTFSGVIPQDSHNIQTHDVSISMLEDAAELRKSQESLPSQFTLLQDCSVLMTPPRQDRRCLAPINVTTC